MSHTRHRLQVALFESHLQRRRANRRVLMDRCYSLINTRVKLVFERSEEPRSGRVKELSLSMQ